LKCRGKDPARRYGSAEALAEDLEHWSAGEPIAARPVTGPERFWRWCQRKPAIASLAAAVLFLLVTVAVTSSVLAVQIANKEAETSKEKEAAVAARNQAEEERDQKDKALRREAGLRLTAQSSAALPSNPALALLLGIEGAQHTPGVLANNALAATLDGLHEERTLFSPNGGAYDAVFS